MAQLQSMRHALRGPLLHPFIYLSAAGGAKPQCSVAYLAVEEEGLAKQQQQIIIIIVHT